MKRFKMTALAAAVVLMACGFAPVGMAEAEAASENRYGLVYQNAITRNVSGKVNIRPVN